MMNSNNYFIYDGCYKKPPPTTISDISFLTHLTNNFYKSSVKSVKECETQSLRNNSDFFLINDINSTLNNTTTNCYIPKIDNTNQSLFGSNSLIVKTQQLFDDLFNTKITGAPYITQTGTPDICNTLMYNKNRTLANPSINERCFKYTLDNQYYTPSNYYAYYKKPILNEKNIKMAKDLGRPENYRIILTDRTKETGLKYYEELLKIDNIRFENNGALVDSFKTFICKPFNNNNESALDTQINNLKLEYEKFYNNLDAIQRDLSSISYLNSFDDDTIKALNLNIATKTQELNSMLGSGGANNGRLDDTTLLTQFKIVENSILLLLIISAIFYFSKNKKSSVANGTLV